MTETRILSYKLKLKKNAHARAHKYIHLHTQHKSDQVQSPDDARIGINSEHYILIYTMAIYIEPEYCLYTQICIGETKSHLTYINQPTLSNINVSMFSNIGVAKVGKHCVVFLIRDAESAQGFFLFVSLYTYINIHCLNKVTSKSFAWMDVFSGCIQYSGIIFLGVYQKCRKWCIYISIYILQDFYYATIAM